jgi:fido (protein-threonine AMPylation protein)
VNKILPEILFSSSNTVQSRRISNLIKAGRLRKIASRVYTSNFSDEDEKIVQRNLYLILGHLFPGTIISHRSALEGRPTDTGEIFLTHTYTRQITLPGIQVHLLKGHESLESDLAFVNGLFISSRPRAFLENLQISRMRLGISKVLPRIEIERRLYSICQAQGEDALNDIRDAARSLSKVLKMEDQFRTLDSIISALLRTRPGKGLASPEARARSMGSPYDAARLDLFNRLFSALKENYFPLRREVRRSSDQKELLAFFESYFSNYIEGTEFEIDEAYEIVFRNKIPRDRPEDAHDIMGTFRVAVGLESFSEPPATFDLFVKQLQSIHHRIMEAHPDKLPGEFKRTVNRAGKTVFVDPELVRGTLLKGFDMLNGVEPGLPRAIFMMFIVAEIHPFTDGNGRLARLMMNNELVRQGLSRIILPTVFRDDYLLALRALSRSRNPVPLLKAMDYLQKFTTLLPMSSYSETMHALTISNAFSEPDEARLKMP